MEATAIESELNDLPSTGQPSSHPPEMTSQDSNPEPQATVDTSLNPQDTQSVE